MCTRILVVFLSVLAFGCGGDEKEDNSLEGRVKKVVKEACACEKIECAAPKYKELMALNEEWTKAKKPEAEFAKLANELDKCDVGGGGSSDEGTAGSGGPPPGQSEAEIHEKYEVGQLEAKLGYNINEVCNAADLETAQREGQNMLDRIDSLQAETPLPAEVFQATAGPYIDRAIQCIESMQQRGF